MTAPTHCSLRRYSDGPNICHLKNWVFEGSTDATAWSEIDRCEDNSDLNSSFALKPFSIAQSDPIRAIPLRQIGPNH
jgi:hypothetical protein